MVYDSFIGLAEAQLQYIVDGLLQMKAKGIAKLSVKSEIIKSIMSLYKSIYKPQYSIVVVVRVITLMQMVATLQHSMVIEKLKQRLHHLNLEEYEVIYEADLVKVKPKVEEVAG